MPSALLYGAVASSALLIGAVVGAKLDVPDWVVAGTLALASGALLTAVAFELFEPAVRSGGPWVAGGALLAGSAVFTAVDWFLDERMGGEEGTGLALAAGVTLDGVPENLALGVTLIGGSSGSGLVLLAAIFVANFPEALNSAEYLTGEGESAARAVGLWAGVGVLLALAVVAGQTFFAGVDRTVLALVEGFAAGAVLASVADEMLPDAYEEGGPVVALATAAGFFMTFLLQHAA
ncbi:ZIP family metal transporter [Halomicrobium salinisoli]|uniref:ZIP family metal transporter n=1 Tax=Halomicrobium salinisoli TaxID=2878391 RepID=UPI001CEFBF98|nr:hypothetical protein [Halomicrobium salinisoli]